jgi:phosphatidylinositol glycan class K
MYRSVKSMGIPDSQIILMLADDMPCNARNSFPGEVFSDAGHNVNLYGEDVEVDYRGAEVTVESFLRVLTGRHDANFPTSKRLNTDQDSNILVYMSGHGGDEFLKFLDFEEISSHDIADAIEEMHVKRRYHEVLFMADTCQAGTLATAIKSPNVVAVGSSRLGQNSYAAGTDFQVGLSLIDRFTASTLAFLEKAQMSKDLKSLSHLFSHYKPAQLFSNPLVRADLFQRPLSAVPITDFFGSVLQVQVRQAEEIYRMQFQNTAPTTHSEERNADSGNSSALSSKTRTTALRFYQPQPLEMRLWVAFCVAVPVLLLLCM